MRAGSGVFGKGQCRWSPDCGEDLREINARLIFCSSDQVYVGNGETNAPQRGGATFSSYGVRQAEDPGGGAGLPGTAGHGGASFELDVCLGFPGGKGARQPHLHSKSGVAAGEQIRYPVHDYRSITDVWEVVRNLEYLFRVPAGIYNFGSENDRSTYELVKEFLESAGIGTGILEKNEEAFREQPRNLRMNTEKAAKLGVHFLSSVEALKKAGTCWKHNPA